MTSSTARNWVVVAGGSGGIGRAISTALAADGWNVVVGYHSRIDGAEKTAAAVREQSREAVLMQADLSDPDNARSFAAEVNRSVQVSGVVYAAGPLIPMDFVANISPEQFSRQIDLDLKASYNFVHPFLPTLREAKGAILAVVTPVIERYTRSDLLSSAPKAGVQALIRGIAAEEGRYGVRANAVGVGVVEGDGLWTSLNASGVFTEKGLKQALAAIPLGHFGTEADVGEAARFLMSDRAKWITGQTLNVDGGYSV